MSVRTRLLALVCVLAAPLIAVTTSNPEPAAAASSRIEALSKTVAVEGPNKAGHHAVYIWAHCYGSKTCSGRAALLGQPRYFSWPYSIKGNSSGYMLVYYLGDAGNVQPTGLGPAPGTDGTTLPRTLRVYPSGGTRFDRTVTLERRQTSRHITGHVTGPATGVSDIKVTSWAVSGLVSRRVSTVDVGADRAFSFTSSLKRNNGPGSAYRLSVSAKVDGERREWFFRGSDGRATGGGKTVSEAHAVQVQKMGDFDADFLYGTISGTLSGAGRENADVRVVAPPVTRPGSTAGLRGLDVPYCANELGADTATSGGSYTVHFLPRSEFGDRRYLVAVNPSGSQTNGVIGASGTVWASCTAATKYTFDTGDDDLISYGAGGLDVTRNANLDAGKRRIGFDTDPTYASKLAVHDTWTTLREYVPGTKILDQPILQAGHASSVGQKQLEGVRPGKYWVEAGRRVGCSAWYPSVYHNNDAYLQGSDRGNEQWKTVDGAKAEWANSIKYGFPEAGKKPPKGYVGWMYRDVCRSVSTGDYQLVNAMALGVDAVGSNVSKLKLGATVSGHVSRKGGKSNKEMLVSMYSTQGVLVMRSAYTNSSGNFRIRGLASGNYRIVVNGDSWRGITRSFSGTKTKRVTSGHNYSVGTLHLNG